MFDICINNVHLINRPCVFVSFCLAHFGRYTVDKTIGPSSRMFCFFLKTISCKRIEGIVLFFTIYNVFID